MPAEDDRDAVTPSGQAATVPGPAALLWDFDGTLVDSEPSWHAAESRLVAELGGPPIDEATARSLVGLALADSARTLLRIAGREDLACKYLSQGQKRRVALARLVQEKRALWILDEPFVALDVAAVAQL